MLYLSGFELYSRWVPLSNLTTLPNQPNNSFARAAHFFVHFFIVTAPPRRENVYFHFSLRRRRRRNAPS